MTDPAYRLIIPVMDRSGSMEKIRADMQGGFREFIRDQQGARDAAGNPFRNALSLWQFDTEIERIHAFAPLTAAESWELRPRGGTALWDAIGRAVVTEGEALDALPEEQRPGLVIVLIVSDGQNNSSREFTRDTVKALLERQQETYGWKIMYIGTNQDVFSEASSIGIPQHMTLSYVNTGAGAQGSMSATSRAVSSASAGGAWGYTPADRSEAQQEG